MWFLLKCGLFVVVFILVVVIGFVNFLGNYWVDIVNEVSFLSILEISLVMWILIDW